MKTYEWSNRNTAVKRCPSCNKELEFADMKCPYCGADARTEKRQYSPRLSSGDIQSSYRNRVGAPHQPQGNYHLKTLGTIELLLTIGAILLSVVIILIMANVVKDCNLFIAIFTGVAVAAFLVPLAKGIAITFKNNAAAAKENERTALGVEYEIQQLNEFISTYNKDKEIEAENLEVFAKLLSKLSKNAEKERNTVEELANVVSAVSRKLNIDPVVLPKKEEVTEEVEEAEIEEAAEIEETEVSETAEEAEVAEAAEAVDEEPSEETETEEEAAEDEATEETEEELEELEKELEELEEESEEEAEEIAEEIEEEVEETEPEEEEEEEPKEESEEEAEVEEDEEYADDSDDGFDELFDAPEEDIYVLICPKCKSEFTYTEEQIRNGEIQYNCDVCGAVILTDDEEDDEEEPAYDVRSAYEREIEEEEEPTNRLDSLLDEFDED